MTNILNLDFLFWFCALSGSGMLIIQILLSFLGSSGDDHTHSEGTDAGKARWLSKQALAAFLMLFGWTGLSCLKEFELSTLACLALSFIAGTLALLITALLFRWTKKLHSPGYRFKMEELIGNEAVVYQRIGKGAPGKISVSLGPITHEIDALSLHQEEIPSFSRVKIVKQADEKTVIVILKE